MRKFEKREWLERPTLFVYKRIIFVKAYSIGGSIGIGNNNDSWIVYVDKIGECDCIHKRKIYFENGGKPYFKIDNKKILLQRLIAEGEN